MGPFDLSAAEQTTSEPALSGCCRFPAARIADFEAESCIRRLSPTGVLIVWESKNASLPALRKFMRLFRVEETEIVGQDDSSTSHHATTFEDGRDEDDAAGSKSPFFGIIWHSVEPLFPSAPAA
mmetsp:Transcript_36208/g.113052  ORF Transcript_36208/g.113052 Transcript_36208/m.113052 type:complete len:124 (-) Transcript_36208:363-734(-)